MHHCRIFTIYQIAGQGHLLPVNDGKAMKNGLDVDVDPADLGHHPHLSMMAKQ